MKQCICFNISGEIAVAFFSFLEMDYINLSRLKKSGS